MPSRKRPKVKHTKLELEALRLAREAKATGSADIKKLADEVKEMARVEEFQKEQTKELEKQAQHYEQLKQKAKELQEEAWT